MEPRSAPRYDIALLGGGAAKVSEWYEEAWNLYLLIDVAAGLARRMLLEEPPPAGHGFESWIDRDDRREWHQVKYQNSTAGKWTYADLKREKVLERFRAKLVTENNAACCFVSAHAASPLDLLCGRAAKARSLSQFLDDLLTLELTDAFRKLLADHWPLSEEEAWQWLRGRVFVRVMDQMSLEERVNERAQTYFGGTAGNVRNALISCLKSGMHNEIDAEMIREALAAEGCTLRPPGDGSIAGLVSATSQDFVSAIRAGLIEDTFLPRAQLSEVQDLLARRDPPRVILATGFEGCGKSALIAELVRERLVEGRATLTLDAERLSRERTAEDIGGTLGLDALAPAKALAIAADRGTGAMVIDAADSVRESRGKSIDVFLAMGRVIREALAYPNLTLVISCREEDLENDERLRQLLVDRAATERVHIPVLSSEAVEATLALAGATGSSLTESQLEMLRLPALLRYYIFLIRRRRAPDFNNPEQLKEHYYEAVIEEDK